jgi:mycoredoxin-dependent peroxiredoxin
MAIAAGDAAPAFALRNQHGTPVSPADFAGSKDLLIVFFPFAFSSVCGNELAELRDRADEIVDDQTEVVAISCDPRYSLRAYADREGFAFSLLSDFWPHGAVSRAYDAFDEGLGCSARVTVVVDRVGDVRGAVSSDIDQPRDFDEYLRVVADLRRGPAAGI